MAELTEWIIEEYLKKGGEVDSLDVCCTYAVPMVSKVLEK